MTNPRFLLTLGMILMLLGIILPYLMIIHVLTSTYFMNFFAWGISVTGLALSTVGFGIYTRLKKDE